VNRERNRLRLGRGAAIGNSQWEHSCIPDEPCFSQIMDCFPLKEFRGCVDRLSRRLQGSEFLLPRPISNPRLCPTELPREFARHRSVPPRDATAALSHGFSVAECRATIWRMPTKNGDWRIYADLAQVLIGQARLLYSQDQFGVELKDTVYALDSTTIDLCLSLFPWAPWTNSKACGGSCLRCSICAAAFLRDRNHRRPCER